MNENINLVEILKDCPKGMELYSPIFGEVEFGKIVDNKGFSIQIFDNYGCKQYFTSDGKFTLNRDAECMLFPSNENRDWKKFVSINREEEINIEEILKLCPRGIKLYSPVFGEVEYWGIRAPNNSYNKNLPIMVYDAYGSRQFTSYGKFTQNRDAKCILFPSYENRDWKTFKIPTTKYDIKPFDRVLVRKNAGNTNDNIWTVSIYSHFDKTTKRNVCSNGHSYVYCIPYEGNEHLLGTSIDPEEKGNNQ